MELTTLLAEMMERGASDLHLVAGQPPVFRVNGLLTRREAGPLLEAADLEALLLPHLPDDLRAALQERQQDVTTMLRWENRPFAFHVFRERDRLAAALRGVPNRVPTLDDLNFAPEVADVLARLAQATRGLILVTGPTGSGKTTTLAALIETINQTRSERIITLETLIEYEFTSKQSLISQRLVGRDVPDFPYGARSALREDCDVVLVSDLKDLETASLALAIADTGHLVLFPMHAPTASAAVARLIDVYPEPQQEMLRAMLSRNLVAVIAQRLLPRAERQGYVPANEILIASPRVRQLIREGRSDLTVAIEAGRDQGMQTMDDALVRLFERGVISFDLAESHLEDRSRIPPVGSGNPAQPPQKE